jgi:Tfp pilus assembly protein PilP
MKRLLLPLALLVLAGCTSDSEDLKRFVRESDKRVPPKI